jgi:acetyl esterase/lipase
MNKTAYLLSCCTSLLLVSASSLYGEEYNKGHAPPDPIELAKKKHERQVLDFWKAPAASVAKPVPLVFYIHGGSWLAGSKEIINGNLDVNALLKASISVNAINYRYVSQAKEAGILPLPEATTRLRENPHDCSARVCVFRRLRLIRSR